MTSNQKNQENKPGLKLNFTLVSTYYKTFSDIFLCHRALFLVEDILQLFIQILIILQKRTNSVTILPHRFLLDRILQLIDLNIDKGKLC